MATLRTLVQHAVPTAAGVALDRGRSAEAARRGVALLRLFEASDEALALGRFHPAVPGAMGGGVVRRLSGGRVFPAGPGFLGVSLALPRWSTLPWESQPLRAEQVMNRAVRPLLGALAALGLDAAYPGRDLVTVGGKPIGWISIGSEDGESALVEMGLAVASDLARLPMLADRLDPGGAVAVTPWLPDDVTSVERECGPTPMHDVVTAVLEGWRARLGVDVVLDDGAPAAGAGDSGALAWDVAPGYARRGERRTMLGTLVARLSLGADGTVAGVRLCGDLIAPRPTVLTLEAALRGIVPERASLAAALGRVVARPEHFLLGVTADDVAAAVAAGAAA